VNWLLGAYGSACGSSWGSSRGPVESPWGKLLGKLSITNSKTLPLAPPKGAPVEGPKGVRSEVWWGLGGS
jgi:hypothetical protein